MLKNAYRSDYLASITVLIKRRVRLATFTVIALLIILTAIFRMLNVDYLQWHELFVWGVALIATATLLLLTRRARSVREAKFCGFLFSVVFLLALTSIQIRNNDLSGASLNFYLLTYFTVSMIIPWDEWDVLYLAIAHVVSYAIFYIYANTDFFAHEYLRSSLSSLLFNDAVFLNSLVYFCVSFFLCFMIRRMESERDYDNFVLLRENQKENETNQRELELATKVHKTLIPQSTQTRNVDIEIFYHPVHYVSGDYANYLVENHQLHFMIADVEGHGVPAALIVNRIHAEYVRLVTREEERPGQLLYLLNRFIYRDFKVSDITLSAFCGMIDYRTQRMTYASFGHLPQMLMRAAQQEVVELKSQAPLIGVSAGEYQQSFETEIHVNAGDRLLLYTDGITDAEDEHLTHYGLERVRNFLRQNYELSNTEFNRRLIDDLRSFKKGEFQDDLFLMDIRIKDLKIPAQDVEDWR